MARRDTNSRIVPEEVQNTRLEPQARPVDKEIKYQPDIVRANQYQSVADGLAKLGQGLVDIDPVITRKAQENILASQAKLEEKNKRDWAKVSRKISLLGKFNPYNKRAYNQITAAQMQREAQADLFNDIDWYKRSPEDFNKITQESFNNLSNAYKAAGIGQSDYIASLENYNQVINQRKLQYAQAHAQWEFGQTKNKIQSEGAFNIQKLVSETEDKVIGLQTAFDGSQALMNSLGWGDDTQAEVILNSVRDAVVADPSSLSTATVQGALKDYKINGKTLKEIVPDYDIKLKQMIREAKMADFQDRKLEFDMQQFEQKMAVKNAFDNLVPRYINGELNNPDTFKQAVLEQAQANGLDGLNSIELFNDIISGRQTITSLKANPSDPETKMNLGAGVADGTTTRDEIAEAIRQGKLSFDDGANMLSQLTTQEQKVKTAQDKRVDEHIKNLTNEYLKDNKQTGTKAVLKSKDSKQWLLNQANDLKAQYEQGKITYDEFNKQLAERKQVAKQYEETKRKGLAVSAMKQGYEDLKATPQITDKQWESLNIESSKLALRRMGIVRTNQNRNDYSLEIKSAPQKNRKITVTDANGKTYTKTTRHTGFDLTSPNGTTIQGRPVFSPLRGEVVGVSLEENNKGMGNMVLIQCSNGNMIKYMHLQRTGLPPLGTKITQDTIVGYIGNTGDVANKNVGSIHVEFYDKNHNWIPANKFGV